jgi:hypothetical protein
MHEEKVSKNRRDERWSRRLCTATVEPWLDNGHQVRVEIETRELPSRDRRPAAGGRSSGSARPAARQGGAAMVGFSLCMLASLPAFLRSRGHHCGAPPPLHATCATGVPIAIATTTVAVDNDRARARHGLLS